MTIGLMERKQFIVDASGKPIGVLLDLSTYESLREAAEANADIGAYRASKNKVAKEIARGDFATLENYRDKRLQKRK